MDNEFFRPSEQRKIECEKKHFKLAESSGSDISLEHVSNVDDFMERVLARRE